MRSTTPLDRDRLRRQLRERRRLLSENEQADAARAVAAAAQPLLQGMETVAGYFAFQGELCVTELLRQCRTRGQTSCVPLLNGTSLVFCEFDDETPMRCNRFNILEPLDQRSTLTPDELDAVLVPLVGFDPQGNRLGMGGGFYDRSFAFRLTTKAAKPMLIGVAYDFQQVPALPVESWDVPLDVIITESSMIDRR